MKLAKDTLNSNDYRGDTIPTRELLIASLTALIVLQDKIEREESLPWPTHGLCCNWQWHIAQELGRGSRDKGDEAYRLLEYLAILWPHSTRPGELCNYPVPNTFGLEIWEGPNRAMRLDLVRYMRKRLRDLIRRRTPR